MPSLNRFASAALTLLASAPLFSPVRAQSADWPVYGGNADNSHYTTLSQITPANVKRLKVAWTYATHDEFKDSEMQANAIIVDGVLYATTPKLHIFARGFHPALQRRADDGEVTLIPASALYG